MEPQHHFNGKLDSLKERIWYATKTMENKWGKRALEDWISRDIYPRQGKAVTNFSLRLPEPQSSLAQETISDPYFFDFLNLPPGHIERDLEDGLVEKIQETLLAFGHGFAFVKRGRACDPAILSERGRACDPAIPIK